MKIADNFGYEFLVKTDVKKQPGLMGFYMYVNAISYAPPGVSE